MTCQRVLTRSTAEGSADRKIEAGFAGRREAKANLVYSTAVLRRRRPHLATRRRQKPVMLRVKPCRRTVRKSADGPEDLVLNTQTQSESHDFKLMFPLDMA